MRILWLGVFDDRPWRAEYALLRQLRLKGMEIDTVNKRAAGFNIADVRDEIQKADVVFLQNGRHFRAEWLDEIAKPVVYWASEASLGVAEHILTARRRPDFVISHSRQVFDYCRTHAIATRRIHNAFDPGQYSRLQTAKLYDICVAGNMSKRRKRIYRRICKRLAGNARVCLLPRYSPAQANAMYNQSRIVLHIHAINENYLPSRFFEVIPTSAVFVCESMGSNYDERIGRGFFEEYSMLGEVAAKCLRIIREPALQDNMTRKANAVARMHTWEKRADEFVDVFRRTVRK